MILRRCTTCGLVFHSEHSSTELTDYYRSYYHAGNLAFSRLTEARYHQLQSSFEEYRVLGRILDIGCGAGQFLKVASDHGWDGYGTEIAAGAFAHLSRLGIRHFDGDVRAANFPPGFFDVVYCSEVLEHVPDPGGLLREIWRIVRGGGLLYLTTPNYNSLSRRLVGSKWRVFSEEHICYFTPEVLVRAARDAGFTNIECTTRNIDLNELRRAWMARSADPDGGFQLDANERLRGRLAASRILTFGKNSVNALLAWAGAGDTIVVRACK